MDFFDACTVLLRRWYITVPLLVLTVAGMYIAYSNAGSQYTANGSLVFELPSARSIDGEDAGLCPTNPWCSGGDLLSIGNVTSLSMADPVIEKRLLEGHPGAKYEVALSNDNRSSIINFEVTGSTPEDTLATLSDVRQGIDDQLRSRQANRDPLSQNPVDPADFVTASEVAIATKAQQETGSKTRSAAAALALGLAATVGGVFLVESIANSRKERTSLLDRIAQGAETPAPREVPSSTKAPPSPKVPSPKVPPAREVPSPSTFTGSQSG